MLSEQTECVCVSFAEGDLMSTRSRKTRDRVAEPLKSNTAIVNAQTEANGLYCEFF